MHDELDLMPGQVKIKFGGGHAGHNGLRDIHAQLGSADYWRLRLGIGHPGVKAEVVDYVLRKPPPEQRELIEQTIERSVDALDLLLAGEMERAMMKMHAKPPRPKAPRPSPRPTGERRRPDAMKLGLPLVADRAAVAGLRPGAGRAAADGLPLRPGRTRLFANALRRRQGAERRRPALGRASRRRHATWPRATPSRHRKLADERRQREAAAQGQQAAGFKTPAPADSASAPARKPKPKAAAAAADADDEPADARAAQPATAPK